MQRSICAFSLALALILAGCGQAATPTPSPSPTPAAATQPSPTATRTPRPTPAPTPPRELTGEQIESIALGSVLVEALVEEQGELVSSWWGSGTILASNGLILTNAHVVLGADALVISLITRTDRPPIPSYYAEPVEVNNVLDLALIQITTDLDGNPVARSELRLPEVVRGNSDTVDLGQDICVFGYPGVGGETLTLTKGAVSGFESEDLGGGQIERVWIKTDAEIAPGNSGGTVVDERGLLVGIPTLVLTDETAGRISRLRPVNLVNYLTSQPPRRVAEASIYEPNDDPSTAYGPLEPGTVYTAYIHQGDLDIYFIEVETLGPIEVDLTDIAPDVDYDLGLFSADFILLRVSEGETTSEHIDFQPRSTGTYYIVVAPWLGYSLEDPYTLQAVFNDEITPPVLPEPGGVTVQGRLVDANTGQGIVGATMALLLPGVTGEEFMAENLSQDLVQVSSTTDEEGVFILNDVPRGQVYTGVVVTENDVFWENAWLLVDEGAPAILYVGDIMVGTS
ncbi:MAG: trypsin-like serine protease [Anaerolineae bacterium]|nr:trypsin-like serine protease [Anaerolineae bacterium]NIN97924.1 trypsin-like serine protease [Anaerolineae bacterium]NIQ80898.1 trypsin-like serine protease [Anaerolineae bacterium]